MMKSLEYVSDYALDNPKIVEFYTEFFRASFSEVKNPMFMENMVETLPKIMKREADLEDGVITPEEATKNVEMMKDIVVVAVESTWRQKKHGTQ